MPPPAEVMRDKRARRSVDRLRQQLEDELDQIDQALEDDES